MIDEVLAQFTCQSNPPQIIPLHNAGGFSGARIWRVEQLGQSYALRRWPKEHPNRERLAFIHAVQSHYCRAEISSVPQLVPTVSGETFCRIDDSFWELSHWMPGEPSFHSQPTDAKLAAAMETLAALHSASEGLERWCSIGVSPGLQLRLELAENSTPQQLTKLATQIDDSFPQITTLCGVVIDHSVRLLHACRNQIQAVGLPATKLVPCIRDVWHDHVLFTGDDVSGIIDFGAMQIESPASDIARLLGSLVGDDQRAWEFALQVYRTKRPLSDVELAMTRALDIANVTFSGINWVRWLYEDRRHFADIELVQKRLAAIEDRQRTCCELMRIGF